MDVDAFLKMVRSTRDYKDQIVHTHEIPASAAAFGTLAAPLSKEIAAMLATRGISNLYSHQATAIEAARQGRDVLLSTGTASGKSLCYIIPLLEMLARNPNSRGLLLFPTKALCQDQFQQCQKALIAAGMGSVLAGVVDGDTPSNMRRKLRDQGRLVFTNPDMLHAALMPQHARWAAFLANLRILVLDELHVYNGIFGTNMANLLRRFYRVCAFYRESRDPPASAPPPTGALPQIIASSATINHPVELARELTGRDVVLVDHDGSPRGRRVVVLWNPPHERSREYRSRRSANVEAHELMTELLLLGIPTITFSKARVTAEMIHRYVCEALAVRDRRLTKRVTPYRGGYRPQERRAIEKRLFDGELIGVSTTSALELGIDVGGLDASIIVGYPGTLASFFQQAGRAGRQDRESLVILIGLDTAINQYIMTHPEYLFEHPLEQGVIDKDNPFVITQHLRCATHELPLPESDASVFGPHATLVLHLLEENHKVKAIGKDWYHASSETPQHESSLRGHSNGNVLIENVDTGEMIGEVDELDAPPLLHPHAIYIHLGETYLVLELDLERHLARVKPVAVDYYTQPLGGTDIHHIDHRLREKPFGTGTACWGEVTAYFGTYAFEKIRFYTLDAFETHELDLPITTLDTMAVWIVPPEELMLRVRDAGLDTSAGLRGIGYATRMRLPLFLTCRTLDFSHTIGSVNSEWQAVFIYERYVHGLGFTEKAYDQLHLIMPRVLDALQNCDCEEGCPCCVGKPLRGYATWNVERGEASIPSKKAAIMILEGLLADGDALLHPDSDLGGPPESVEENAASRLRLERALRRRLERDREPDMFHPIEPKIKTAFPDIKKEEVLDIPDVTERAQGRSNAQRDLRKRLAKKIDDGKLPALGGKRHPPDGMGSRRGNLSPTAFKGRPAEATSVPTPPTPEVEENGIDSPPPDAHDGLIQLGDSLAARARRKKRKK